MFENPYAPPANRSAEFDVEHESVKVDAPKLLRTQEAKLKQLILDRVHPGAVDSFLRQLGYSDLQINAIYFERNWSRKNLLYWYKTKRNVQIVGGVVVLLALISAGFGTVSIPVGLLAYGIALIWTGRLTIVESQRVAEGSRSNKR